MDERKKLERGLIAGILILFAGTSIYTQYKIISIAIIIMSVILIALCLYKMPMGDYSNRRRARDLKIFRKFREQYNQKVAQEKAKEIEVEENKTEK